MTSNHEDVGEFHRKFGLRHGNDGDHGPAPQDRELLGFRLNFLLEELIELMEAVGATFEVEYEPPALREPGDEEGENPPIMGMKIVMGDDSDIIDDAQAFDALLDLNYVSHGTAHLLGYPWQIGWNAVQSANMAKERAASDGSNSKRGSSFDVVKPAGWTPPNIQKILDDHGWRKQPTNCPVCGNAYAIQATACEPGICRKGA